jgi:hypothetical protein
MPQIPHMACPAETATGAVSPSLKMWCGRKRSCRAEGRKPDPKRPEIRSRERIRLASDFGLQASGGKTMSAEDRAELVTWYGELIRGP